MPLSKFNDVWVIGTWIAFSDSGLSPSGKTRVYEVFKYDGKGNVGGKLGDIKWFGSFRKYSWYPAPNTVYEEVCNQEITDFLVQVNKAHREKRNAAHV